MKIAYCGVVSASGTTVFLVSEELKIIRIFAADHPPTPMRALK